MAVNPIVGIEGKVISYEVTCYDAGGHLLRRRFRTRKEAQAFEAEQRLSRQIRGGTITARDLTVSQLWDLFAGHWIPTVKPATVRNREVAFHLHIEPEFGKVRLDKLRPEQIQTYYRELAETYAPNTLQIIHSTLSMMLRWAMTAGILNANPLASVHIPRTTRGRVRNRNGTVWTIEEMRAALVTVNAITSGAYDGFLGPMPRAVAPMVLMILWTGLRSGEVRALQWEDVSETTIEVRHTWSPIRGHPAERGERARECLGSPKTKSSQRQIMIMPPIKEILAFQRRVQTERNFTGPWVFDDGDDRWVSVSQLRQTLKHVAEIAGVRPITAHGLRHTFATANLSLGVSAKVVQEALGHSSIMITLDTYTHVDRALQESAGDQFVRGILADPRKEVIDL